MDARAAVEENMPLILRLVGRAIARRPALREYRNDLISECAVRIMEKFPEWDPGKGKISTWIWSCLRHTLTVKASLVKGDHYGNSRRGRAYQFVSYWHDHASLDEEIETEEGIRAGTLHDSIPGPAVSPETLAMAAEIYHVLEGDQRSLAGCDSSKRKEGGRLLLVGFRGESVSKAGEALGIHKSWASRLVRQTREQIRKDFDE